MSWSHLTPEQGDLAERIYQNLQTEFEVRDRVHKIGAKAFETALDERKKGATKGPA